MAFWLRMETWSGAFAGGQAEDKLEVPDADAHMDAVGVGLAVVGCLNHVHMRLLHSRAHGLHRLLRLGRRPHRTANAEWPNWGIALEGVWCERGDSNPHGLPRQILSLVRLPIPPLSRIESRDFIQLLHSIISRPCRFWREDSVEPSPPANAPQVVGDAQRHSLWIQKILRVQPLDPPELILVIARTQTFRHARASTPPPGA